MQQIVEAHRLTIERRFSTQQRRISGYALDKFLPDRGYDVVGLLCGSEGTLATTLEATVDLVALPAARVLLVLGFEDPVAAADAVPVLLPHDPLTMESINAALVDRLPAQTRADELRAAFRREVPGCWSRWGARARSRRPRPAPFWKPSCAAPGCRCVHDSWRIPVRRRCSGDAAATGPGWRADGAEAWAGWGAAAVPPTRLGEYLRRLDELMARYGLSGASYGHFGEGCMHMRMDFDLLTSRGSRSTAGSSRRPTSSSSSAGRSPESTETDGPGRSC